MIWPCDSVASSPRLCCAPCCSVPRARSEPVAAASLLAEPGHETNAVLWLHTPRKDERPDSPHAPVWCTSATKIRPSSPRPSGVQLRGSQTNAGLLAAARAVVGRRSFVRCTEPTATSLSHHHFSASATGVQKNTDAAPNGSSPRRLGLVGPRRRQPRCPAGRNLGGKSRPNHAQRPPISEAFVHQPAGTDRDGCICSRNAPRCQIPTNLAR